MKIKGLIEYDIVNYRKPSMFIIFPSCTFKCDKEYGTKICQNSCLANEPIIECSYQEIVKRYINNPLTSAFVIGGLEPFDSLKDLFYFIKVIREVTNDDIVIYTGYTEQELCNNEVYKKIILYNNIIIKYGRYVPDKESHFDKVLGVKLASPNQYAIKYNDFKSQ